MRFLTANLHEFSLILAFKKTFFAQISEDLWFFLNIFYFSTVKRRAAFRIDWQVLAFF